MEVTPAFYAHLTSSLMSLAQGKLAVVLEVCLDDNLTLFFLNFVFTFFLW